MTFEIWTRHDRDEHYRPKDPRRESPDFTTEIRPAAVMWRSSMLPRIDLTEHGLSRNQARNAVYRVQNGSGESLFVNRADGEGLIEGMACPSFEVGASVEIEVERGPTLQVKIA